MRSIWSRIPMLRVLFALMAGIGLEIAFDNHYPSSTNSAIIVAALLAISLIMVLVLGKLKSVTMAYRLRQLNGVALTITLVSFGYLLTWFYTQKNYQDSFSNFLSGQNVLVVSIKEPPVLRDKVVMVYGEVKEVTNGNGHFKTTGNIQLSFLRDSICEGLQYGDVVLIKSKIDTTDGPKNPYEHNFKAGLAFRNIYHKAFVTSALWALIDSNQGNLLLASVYQLRKSFLTILSRYITDKFDFGVASAIMLGYRDYLSPDIYQAYQNSGTVQILSVSAFHVGIMFFMLNFLLQWMDKRGRKMLWAKTMLIIAFIWFYACLTGLSLPVLRCATVFTLIQMGMLLLRNVNRYNIVAGSAVLLLLIDPFMLTEVGFQLSYLAVFGLYFVQPKIANLFIIKIPDGPRFERQSNWLLKPITFLMHDMLWLALKSLDFIWQLTAASVAAQIAILPLCLFYFYQFPNLFLLSNLVVIPLSNLLIFTGTLLFAVGRVPYLNDAVGWIFNHLLLLLDKFIVWIDSIPYALTNGICISAIEMILLYLFILLILWLTEERKNKVVISALVVLLALCSFRSYKSIERSGQKEIVVYAVSKQKAIAFISDKSLYYDFDSALISDRNNMQLHILHHWWEIGVSKQTAINDSSETTAPGIYSKRISAGQIVLFEGKKVLIVDSLSVADYSGTKQKLKPDLVILSGTLKVSLPILKKSVDFNDVVFDSRCRPASRKRWKKDCAELNINYWDVNAQGAYIWNLKEAQP